MKESKKSGIPTGDILWIVFIVIGTGILCMKIAIDLVMRHAQ